MSSHEILHCRSGGVFLEVLLGFVHLHHLVLEMKLKSKGVTTQILSPFIFVYWQWLKVLFLCRIILFGIDARDPVEKVLSQFRKYKEDPKQVTLRLTAAVASAVFISSDNS